MLSGRRKLKKACDAEDICVAACLCFPLTSELLTCCWPHHVIPVLYVIDKIVYFPTQNVPMWTTCSEVEETLESGWSYLIFSRVWHLSVELKWYWKAIPWGVNLKIFQASTLIIGGWMVVDWDFGPAQFLQSLSTKEITQRSTLAINWLAH